MYVIICYGEASRKNFISITQHSHHEFFFLCVGILAFLPPPVSCALRAASGKMLRRKFCVLYNTSDFGSETALWFFIHLFLHISPFPSTFKHTHRHTWRSCKRIEYTINQIKTQVFYGISDLTPFLSFLSFPFTSLPSYSARNDVRVHNYGKVHGAWQ